MRINQPDISVEALRIFIEVASHGSFSLVARSRDVDPSSISRIIAGLEQALGLRLFQRSTRRIELTEAGALYLGRIEPLVEQLEAARDEAEAINAGPSGTLRFSASVAFGTVCIVPLLAEFGRRFPLLKLDLVLTDTTLDLIGEKIDLAVRLAPSVDADVTAFRLMDTRYRVVAAPAYLAAAPPLRLPDDLRQHRCLRFHLPDFKLRWMFRSRAGVVTEVPVDGGIVISTALALRDCALAGLGPALLPDWLIDREIVAGRLIDCLPDYHAAATSFDIGAFVLYPSRSYLPRKVRVTIDFLREKFGSGAARTAPLPIDLS